MLNPVNYDWYIGITNAMTLFGEGAVFSPLQCSCKKICSNCDKILKDCIEYLEENVIDKFLNNK